MFFRRLLCGVNLCPLALKSVRGLSTRFSPSSHQLDCDLYLLNVNGSLEIQSGPFDRGEICEKYSLEARDLQKIDTDLHITVPLIDVRPRKFICFSFRRHRSLVQSTRSVFFVPSTEKVLSEPHGMSDSTDWEHISQAYHDNVHRIHQSYNQRMVEQAHFSSIPFEFHLSEINLESIAENLRTKTYELLSEFENVRERAYARINVASLRELVLLKERVDKHKRNADLAHKAIVDVLAHDEDLIGMYLTDARPRQLAEHVQIEFLLEASTKQMAEVCRPISDLSDSLQTLENSIGFMLDAVRNELLAFEIRINIITMGLGVGAFIAGVFGMNFATGLETHPSAFYLLTGTSICLMSAIIALSMNRLLRYRKIRLHRTNKLKIF